MLVCTSDIVQEYMMVHPVDFENFPHNAIILSKDLPIWMKRQGIVDRLVTHQVQNEW